MAMNEAARGAVKNQEEQQRVQRARRIFSAEARPIGNAVGHCFEHYVTVGTSGTLKNTIDARAHQCQRHLSRTMQTIYRTAIPCIACFSKP
jgi:hypothetical protein